MMVQEMDRVYAGEGWLLKSSGHHGVLVPCAVPPSDAKSFSEITSTAVKLWTGVVTVSHQTRSLLDRLDMGGPCADCKGTGKLRCRYCHGTGKQHRSCDHCDEEHECICGDCDEGFTECSACGKPLPLVVFGLAFNRRLVADLIVAMRLDPEKPIAASLCEHNQEVRSPSLVFRQGDTVGVVMPCLFSEEQLVDAPKWPEQETP